MHTYLCLCLYIYLYLHLYLAISTYILDICACCRRRWCRGVHTAHKPPSSDRYIYRCIYIPIYTDIYTAHWSPSSHIPIYRCISRYVSLHIGIFIGTYQLPSAACIGVHTENTYIGIYRYISDISDIYLLPSAAVYDSAHCAHASYF